MLETFMVDKSQLIEHISTTRKSEKIIWVYSFVLWVLTIVSCVLKMNFHSSYSVFMVERSGAPDINMYLVIDFSFDLATIILYVICIFSATKNMNLCMRLLGFCLLSTITLRFYYGVYFLYEGYQFENEDVKFQDELHKNIVYEICLEIFMLPVALIGGILILLLKLSS